MSDTMDELAKEVEQLFSAVQTIGPLPPLAKETPPRVHLNQNLSEMLSVPGPSREQLYVSAEAIMAIAVKCLGVVNEMNHEPLGKTVIGSQIAADFLFFANQLKDLVNS